MAEAPVRMVLLQGLRPVGREVHALGARPTELPEVLPASHGAERGLKPEVPGAQRPNHLTFEK